SFFTVGEDEVRAWTVRRGDRAARAAGRIHSDLEKSFVRAEVVHYDDFIAAGSEHRARGTGKLRLEGKEYVVQDGAILQSRGADAQRSDGGAKAREARLPGQRARREGPPGRRISRTERSRHDAVARPDGRSRPRARGVDGRRAAPAVEAASRGGGCGIGGDAGEEGGHPSGGKAAGSREERATRAEAHAAVASAGT